MKKKILQLMLLLVCFAVAGLAQEKEQESKSEDKPVRSPFEGGLLINNQTGVIPYQNTLEMLIQHRFGSMDNGFSDLFGIYAPGANLRLGFNYSLLDNIMVGYGLTKNNMHNDFQLKYALLQQTRSGRIPVAVTFFGNMAIDGRSSEVFGVNYKFTNRLSYFGQIIIGRKFTEWMSVQAQGSFIHYNSVATQTDHDKIGIGASGRIKFSPQSSFIFEYDIPISIQNNSESKPNLGFGYEVSTSTHIFQIYAGTAQGIIQQNNYMFNQNDFMNGEFMFGFTITRLWSF